MILYNTTYYNHFKSITKLYIVKIGKRLYKIDFGYFFHFILNHWY